MSEIEVVTIGPLATVQDLGRVGLGSLGVGHSGAADAPSLRLGNRLLGNPESDAGLEVTFGGLEVRARGSLTVAVTGAPCPVSVDSRPVASNTVLSVADGSMLRLGAPSAGLRTYVAVRGGIDVAPVLGSRSTDVLAELGPPPLSVGMRLPISASHKAFPGVDVAPVRTIETGDVTLRITGGPRLDWFAADAMATLTSAPYEVSADSNRVGMRLSGPPLERSRKDELASEGMVCGALQVPPSGQPTLFLADHPVTGGYPVIAVVAAADLGRAAQVRPGQRIRFSRLG